MLEPQQVLALAPDASSVAAAKKLAVVAPWRSLGRDARAVWGECRGSQIYQYKVGVDAKALTSTCSCPSRKVPCKHALGLMLLAANDLSSIPEQSAPAWVTEWIDKRDVAIERRQTRPEKEPDPVAQKKREDAREARVDKGLDAFDRFSDDLIRTGLAGLESQPGTFEAQAARLVDAQAAGLASRVRRLEGLVGGGPDWPDRLLDRLGKLALLTRAWRRRESLDAPLAEDVRLAIGFSLDQREVVARGTRVRDLWTVIAQVDTDDDRLRSQRSWLRGTKTGRTALILQFAPGTAPFPHTLIGGSTLDAELVYFPSGAPTRALIDATFGEPGPLGDPPGFVSIGVAFSELADTLSRNPWSDRALFTLSSVVPLRHDGRFFVRDAEGRALPLGMQGASAPWLLFASSGGHPIQVVGEWNGEKLLPLAAISNGVHYALGSSLNTGGD